MKMEEMGRSGWGSSKIKTIRFPAVSRQVDHPLRINAGLFLE